MLMIPIQVKDSEAYEAVASNTSGSTPKDLFEDVTEELEKKVLMLMSVGCKKLFG